MGMEIDKITETIIGCAFTVSNTLGAGFLEKVYENALAIEIQKAAALIADKIKNTQLKIILYENKSMTYHITTQILRRI